MLHLGDYTSALQTSCDQSHTNTAEKVIRAEPFPVTAAASGTTKRASDRQERDVDAFAMIFRPQSFAIG
jgi:hypothetical protein